MITVDWITPLFYLGIFLLTLLACLIAVVPLVLPIKSAAASARQDRYLAVGLGLGLPALALILYGYWGSGSAWLAYHKQQQQSRAVTAEIQHLGSLPNIIQRLEQTLARHPDGQGFFLLGRLYLKNQQFPEAVAAFLQADRFSPGRQEVWLGLAQAYYFAQGNTLTPKARDLLLRILSVEPKQKDALYLLGLGSYQEKNYSEAVQYWESLLSVLPPNTEDAQRILQMIAEAQKRISISKKTDR